MIQVQARITLVDHLDSKGKPKMINDWESGNRKRKYDKNKKIISDENLKAISNYLKNTTSITRIEDKTESLGIKKQKKVMFDCKNINKKVFDL